MAEEDIVNDVLASLRHQLQLNLQRLHPCNLEDTIRFFRFITYESSGITAGGHRIMSWTQFDRFLQKMIRRLRRYYVAKIELVAEALPRTIPLVVITLICEY